MKLRFRTQTTSPFFSKLHSHARTLVYLELFSSARVVVEFCAPGDHLRPGPRGWIHHKCQESSKKPLDGSISWINRNCVQVTSLLLSCQKVYAEAVRMLYSSITMVFNTPDLFFCFKFYFRPKAEMLRSCEFYCAIFPDEPQGISDLDLLTRALEGRQNPLRVRIRVYNPDDYDGAFDGDFDNSAAQQVAQAIQRIVSMPAISGSIFLPSQLEDATRDFAHEHSARVSLIFLTDYMPDGDGSEVDGSDMAPDATEEGDEDDQGDDVQSHPADDDD